MSQPPPIPPDGPPPIPDPAIARPPLPDVDAEVPWQEPTFLPLAPPTVAYGCVDSRDWTPCSREELSDRISNDTQGRIIAVWTPDHPTVLPPEEVPFLREAARTRHRKMIQARLKRSLINAVIWTLLFGRFLLADGPERSFGILLVTVLVVIPIALGLLRLARVGGMTADQVANLGTLRRFGMWIGSQKPRATRTIAGGIVLVGISQLAFVFSHAADNASSLQGIALLEEEIRNGEWWRILTAIFGHGGIIHFGFNMFALLALGRQVEALAHWVYIPIVFLLSGVTGCFTSLALIDNARSVGASGGIIGFIGFLVVLEFYHRRRLPRGIFGEMLGNIGLLAVIGLVGIGIIDNAGHFGGLVTGLLLGLLLLRRDTAKLPLKPPGFLTPVAAVCTTVIALSAGLATVMIWR